MGDHYEQALRREQARETLASLLPGGSVARPIVVTSAAVIEPRALAMLCPLCSGEYRLHEHTRPVPGLRRVDVGCRQCRTPRTIWFRLVEPETN
jgi:hypothetical protein